MTLTRDEFTFTVRSYEIDSYRHVNNAAYVNWLEEARERFLRARGQDWCFYPDRLQTWFVVARLDCEYRSPALAGEELHCATRLAKIGRTSAVFRQVVRRLSDARVRCRARVLMVFVDAAGIPVPVPPEFSSLFSVDPDQDRWTESEGGERSAST